MQNGPSQGSRNDDSDEEMPLSERLRSMQSQQSAQMQFFAPPLLPETMDLLQEEATKGIPQKEMGLLPDDLDVSELENLASLFLRDVKKYPIVSMSSAEEMAEKIQSSRVTIAKLGTLLSKVNKARDAIVSLVQQKYGRGPVSQADQEKAQRDIEAATAKVDAISSELIAALQKVSITQQAYLEHQTAVLYHWKDKASGSDSGLGGSKAQGAPGDESSLQAKLENLEIQFAEKSHEMSDLRTEWEETEARFKHRIESIRQNMKKEGLRLEKYDPIKDRTTMKSFDSGVAVTNEDRGTAITTATKREKEQMEMLLKKSNDRSKELERDAIRYKKLAKALKGELNQLKEQKAQEQEAQEQQSKSVAANSADELAKAKKEIQQLQEDNDEANKLIQELQTMVKEYEEQVDELTPQVSSIPSLKDKILDLETRLNEYEETKEDKKAKELLNRLQQKYRETKVQLKKKEDELKGFQEQTDKTMETLQQESDNLFEQNKQLQDRIAQAEKKYAKADQDRELLEQELQEVKADIEARQLELAENEDIEEELNALQQEHNEIKDRCSKLESQEDKSRKEAESLAQKVSELEALVEKQRKEISQGAPAASTKSAVSPDAAALQRKLASMQDRLDKQKQEKRELITLKREVLGLKKDLAKAKKSGGGGGGDSADLEAEIERLKHENKDLQEQMEDLALKNMELAMQLAGS
jgi:chromosome segregation ATPase